MRVQPEDETVPTVAPLAYAGRVDLAPGAAARLFTTPVGWPLSLATVAASVLAVYATSDLGGLGAFMIAALTGLVVGGSWLVRVAGYAMARARQPNSNRVSGWVRWAVSPALLVAAILLHKTGWVDDAVFRLSRPAMERSALRLLARQNGPSRRVDVGLYGVSDAVVEAGVVYFPIDTMSFIDRDGFAYSPAGPPRGAGRSRHLSGPWYRWHDDF